MSASAILKLQRVGFTAEQVEALADFMDGQAASKADLDAATHRVELSIAAVRGELERSIADVRGEMDAAVHKLDRSIADVRGEVASLRADVRLLEQRMTVRLGGMMIVAVGILLAAIRYLPPHP